MAFKHNVNAKKSLSVFDGKQLRQGDRKCCALIYFALRSNLTFMQFYNFFSERESESVTAESPVAGFIDLIKALKYMDLVFRPDTDTGIDNLTAHLCLIGRQYNVNHSTFRREFYSVMEKIHPNLRQQPLVALD